MKVVAFYRLVPAYWYKFTPIQEPGGWSSLLVGAGERVNVVAFYKWVPAYWYEFALVQDCKNIFIYIKKKLETTTEDCFFTHWVSTLNPSVCFLCVIFCFVLIAPTYCLSNT